MGVPKISIVIPTLGREKELNDCLKSLKAQTCQDYQIILITERGYLAKLRNKGLYQAIAPVVSFIDDDTVCSPIWIENILRVFGESSEIMGVSGPAVIPKSYKQNRDIFRYVAFTKLYTYFFVNPEFRPGFLTSAGTFVPEPDYTYQGFVQFLEACNMSFRTEAIKDVGGFDEAYKGIGDWSEPDLCFRLRSRFGDDCLAFDPSIRLEHRPSKIGAYLFRRGDSKQRLDNYRLFARRWVRPHWRHSFYKVFLTTYYTFR